MARDGPAARSSRMKRAERAHSKEERLEYLFIASGWKNLAEAAQRAAEAAPSPEPPEEP